ncbi:MAG: type II toxin-antitoxin system RelE/ParE family toxin [Deltaproteobacteria bacterium]|nr:type II toxin-antitoxin system RelE/ParE family toxin [Deltaproteobacteria bacterium]MBI4373755.1 type II toxin-antitoxin system RelE/ParE family toxin [Deltaproteobacteria bacterium]
MACRIQWTSLALKDLGEIREFIQRDKPIAAKSEARRIKKSVERLSSFPQSGHFLGKIPSVREIVSGNYHIYYRIHGRQVEILRIYHGRRSIVFA